ncbi:MAG: lysine exporter protein LysE/YggA [Deltaproteobacteria bacterium CSP1-8]|jgi:threonine/homoserine/homoserine lactone efflux protein|nr:MAG: lysine exporter protein LysE/YggA [Deltaproteobacteria bacterium CSP1-8]
MSFASPAAIFVSSFIIALSGALMPGPLLAVTVRDTTRQGFVAAPLLVLGHGILEAGLLALLLLGLAEWVRGDVATSVIALAGGAMLFSMAVGMAREVPTLRLDVEWKETTPEAGGSAGRRTGFFRPVLSGIVASISNPYWTIWWATIGLGYLLISRKLGAAGVALFFAGHILADAVWYLFIGFAVSAGRSRFTDRVYRWIVGSCALFLFFFALSFGYFGVTKLFRMW